MLDKIKLFFRLLKNHEANLLKEQQLYKSFNEDLAIFNASASAEQKALPEFLYPCLYDKTSLTNIEPTYFYQDAWAFERIIANKPSKHIDVGSHHKFVAHLSKVVDLTMVDIRPLSLPMDSIKFIEGSILNLPFVDNSVESLSSLCVIEHIGLGRYGDPIDPNGSKKALAEIKRVLKIGGHFYLSVPVSDRYITRFNGGVIFDYPRLKAELEEDYIIADEKFIAQSRFGEAFVPNNNFGTTGLFELIKK